MNVEDKKTLWEMFYAKDSLEVAQEACSCLMRNYNQMPQRIYRSFIISIAINYGKLFKDHKKKREKVIKIFENWIPEDFKNLHSQLIVGRDKALAHTDDNFIVNGEEVHKIIFTLDEKSRILSSYSYPLFAPWILPKILNLFKMLIDKITDNIWNLIGNNAGKNFSMEVGRHYVLDLKDSNFVREATEGEIKNYLAKDIHINQQSENISSPAPEITTPEAGS